MIDSYELRQYLPRPTLKEAIADWCPHCQNTGALRDPVTDKMTVCFHCHRIQD